MSPNEPADMMKKLKEYFSSLYSLVEVEQRTLLLLGLPQEVHVEELKMNISKYASVVEILIAKHKLGPDRAKTVAAMVEFETGEDAQKIEHFCSHEQIDIMSNKLVVYRFNHIMSSQDAYPLFFSLCSHFQVVRRTLLIVGLPPEVGVEELKTKLIMGISEHRPIVEALIRKRKATPDGQKRVIAIVEFETREDAHEIMCLCSRGSIEIMSNLLVAYQSKHTLADSDARLRGTRSGTKKCKSRHKCKSE